MPLKTDLTVTVSLPTPSPRIKRIERSKCMNHTRKKTLWSCRCPLSMAKLLENSARSSSFGLARVQLQSRRTKTNSVAVGTSSSTIMVLYREKNDETFAGEILFDPTNVLRRTISEQKYSVTHQVSCLNMKVANTGPSV